MSNSPEKAVNLGPISRLQKALEFIEQHLDQPLSVDSLAEHSCWSRWQFQRVFVQHTGQTVAQYVRGRRLSHAAKQLLTSKQRQLDIALACGFESEISFNRSFRKEFGCPPGEYRKRGNFRDIRQPLALSRPDRLRPELPPKLLQVKIETRPASRLYGVCDQFNGLFSKQPNYETKIPNIWVQLACRVSLSHLRRYDHIGVIDLNSQSGPEGINYWACLENPHQALADKLQNIDIPEQQYAVIPYTGHVKDFDKTLEWFLCYWLPESGYRGCNGFDLELYGRDFDPSSDSAYMEYWVPISRPEQ